MWNRLWYVKDTEILRTNKHRHTQLTEELKWYTKKYLTQKKAIKKKWRGKKRHETDKNQIANGRYIANNII